MSDKENRLVTFLKSAENDRLAAGDLDALRHASPEGGTDTIGYGHKLTADEIRTGKVHGFRLDALDLESAEAILKVDIANKARSAAKKFKELTGKDWAKDLSRRQREMLVDYEFNLKGGLNTFPSFTRAVADGDEDKMKDEMTRYYTDAEGVTRPLARNGQFYNAFMSNEAKAAYGE